MKKHLHLVILFITSFLSLNAQDFGGMDTTFLRKLAKDGNGTGLLGGVRVHLIQSDGKILVGGDMRMTLNGNTVKSLFRLNSDGTLDNTFTSGRLDNPDSDYISSIVQLSNGKILVGGNFNWYNDVLTKSIIRLNSDGSIDNTFNTTINFGPINAQTIAVQPDGKILVGGHAMDYNRNGNLNIARLNSDGTVDNTFIRPTGGDITQELVRNIALQADGKILISGRLLVNNHSVGKKMLRLNSDGSIDNSFNSGGSGANSEIYAITSQSDGKILIGGEFTTYNGSTVNRITRLNSDGTIDNTFNSSGAGANNNVNAITIQSDGKIIIGGNFTTYNGSTVNGTTRLNSDGTIDNTFNSGSSGANNGVNAIAIQSDGKILIRGYFINGGNGTNRIILLNSDGTINKSYIQTFNIGPNDYINVIVPQNNDKILIGGGFTTYDGITANRITRLKSDGTIDSTFNTGGAGANDVVYAITPQSDGKILIGGNFTTYNGSTASKIARLNSNGTIDNTFNSGGSGFNDNVYTITIQSDGKILIGGDFTTYNGSTVNRITRLNSDGSIDNTFNSGGAGADSRVRTIAIQSDGKILIGGYFTTYNGNTVNYLTRLNSDGTTDNTFNPNAYKLDGGVKQIVIQSDGKILLSGSFNWYNSDETGNNNFAAFITRLNSNGDIDNDFYFSTYYEGNIVPIEGTMSLQNDKKIIIAAQYATGYYLAHIIRLSDNGTPENTSSAKFDNEIRATAIQSDGKFIVGGQFQKWNPEGSFNDGQTVIYPSLRIARLTNNYTVCTPPTITVTASACGAYTWSTTAITYTNSGTYTHTTVNAGTCDIITILHLSIKPNSTSTSTASACSSYTWNGTTYTLSGTYTYTTSNAIGCDSIATLNLTINNSTYSTAATACGSYLWNGNTYTVSGTYTYTTNNAAGCDSIATLNLTINESIASTTNTTACNSYLWNGNIYTVSGTYTFTAQSIAGCDSIATLNLTINPLPTANAGADVTICAGTAATIGAAPTANCTYAWSSYHIRAIADIAASQTTVLNAYPGRYELRVRDTVTGCVKRDSVWVYVNASPRNKMDVTRQLCLGKSTVFAVTTQSNVAYTWSTNLSGVSLSNALSNTVTPTVAGSGTITLAASNTVTGCTSIKTATVITNALPIATAGSPATICQGEVVQLGAIPVLNTRYGWSGSGISNNAIANPTASPIRTGAYRLTVYDSLTKCSSVSTNSIVVKASPVINAGVDQTITAGEAVPLGSKGRALMQYEWSTVSGTAITSSLTALARPTVSALVSSVYALKQTQTATGCFKFDTIRITVNGASSLMANEMGLPAINETNNQDLQVYPNPSSGIVYIAYPSEQEVEQVSLISQLGVIKAIESQVQGEGLISLNLNEIPSGSYVLLIQTTSGLLITKPLVLLNDK